MTVNLKNPDNTEIKLEVNDNSYRYRAIKGENSLTLYYSLAEHKEIPLGASYEFEGETYTLESPENFKKHNNRNFEYTLILESDQAKLKKYKFKDTTTRRLKFSLTAKPQEHLQMLIDNLNQRDPAWTAGSCIDALEKVISYNHTFCSDALSQMAEAFETEWEIVGKTISLHKVGYNKDKNEALPLSYGRGNGFKSGVGRTTGNKKPVEKLYVQGGERNIDASKYGSRELLLPKKQEIGYDGEYFSDQDKFDPENAHWYVTDEDGFSLQRRSEKPLLSPVEDSLDCSHIYPSRVGEVTRVEWVYNGDETTIYPSDLSDKEKSKVLCNFYDTKIDFDLWKHCANGETLTVIFQSGRLAGKEFDVKYTHNDENEQSVRCFELVPLDTDGTVMPNEAFKPIEGDKYAVFGMSELPAAYVCDNENKTGASWDMFREAVKYFYENEEQKYTFTGELDGIWAKKNWPNISNKIKLGRYVLFSDNQFQTNGVAIRIIGIKDFINNPYSPTIELSNEIVGSSISSNLRKIETNEVVMDNMTQGAVQFTKRRFRDSQETIGMIEDALLDRFTNAINPVSVQTMAMLVGDESLQFRFIDDMENPAEVSHTVTYDQEAKMLRSPAGRLQHLTLGTKILSSNHNLEEYKFWDIEGYKPFRLTDSSKSYYFYARVNKINTTGEFILSDEAIKMEDKKYADSYHFLMGILNSEFEGERSYVSLYGFTEILPGRITTEKVMSSDGQNFIDFLNNAFRIGNSNTSLDFNTKKDGKLRLKGTLVQSESGEEQPIGVFRGEYNNTDSYYKGDEVTYQGSTYRYIYQIHSNGNLPTDATYWTVVAAKGNNGQDGQDGAKGDTGTKGDSPALVFRGEYSETATYFGTSSRVDAVTYNGNYYIAHVDTPNGQFANILPTDTDYWNDFGFQADSMATSLLLAEDANIAGWIFRNGRLESQSGDIFLNGNAGDVRLNGTIQLSAGYDGNFSDVNLFYLPKSTTERTITMGYELSDIGKVCRLFNSNEIGGAKYIIKLYTFGIKGNIKDTTLRTISVFVNPQETIEVTCFKLPPNTYGNFPIIGMWEMTSRFSTDNWKNGQESGRFARMLAMGKITGIGTEGAISGDFYNGRAASSVFTISRQTGGFYRISFENGILPTGYKVLLTNNSHSTSVGVTNLTNTYFDVYFWEKRLTYHMEEGIISGMETVNTNGSCDFMIFAPNWQYNF